MELGSGLEISVFAQILNDLAHRRVMNSQVISNVLQGITMLDMRQMNLLIPKELFGAGSNASKHFALSWVNSPQLTAGKFPKFALGLIPFNALFSLTFKTAPIIKIKYFYRKNKKGAGTEKADVTDHRRTITVGLENHHSSCCGYQKRRRKYLGPGQKAGKYGIRRGLSQNVCGW